MTERMLKPLIGPIRQRGWHDIVRFRPLTAFAQTALVVTRRGRLANVVPANGPRTLSDYLTWPYDFREVDMRERLLALNLQLESCDAGYEFGVVLELTYQVVRPERVALDLEDALAELERVVVQTMRLVGHSFGVEQVKALEEHIADALLHSDTLVQRVADLGLALRRANVVVTLDDYARAHADELRAYTRERPLHAQFAIDSLDPGRSFDVQVGGFYRMSSRTPMIASDDAMNSAIYQAIARTLRRVGITFAPQDYQVAAQAMADALRQDALLQAELLVAQVQFLRPTVQIQPDRSMVHVPPAAPASPPASPPISTAPRPEPQPRRPRQGLIRSDRVVEPLPVEESPPWAGLKAAANRTIQPDTSAAESPKVAPLPEVEESPPWTGLKAAANRTLPPGTSSTESSKIAPVQEAARTAASKRLALPDRPQPVESDHLKPFASASAGPSTSTPGTVREDRAENVSPWLALTAGLAEEVPAYPRPVEPHDTIPSAIGYSLEDQPLLSPSRQAHDSILQGQKSSIVSAGSAKSARAPDERIADFLTLLQSFGPVWYKMWSLELMAQPDHLPDIIAEVSQDAAVRAEAESSEFQQALALALQARASASALPAAAPSLAELPPGPVASSDLDGDQAESPDWLRLRQKWNGDGGSV